MTTTAVLDKDENLWWSGEQRNQSCYSNKITPFYLQSYFSAQFFQNHLRGFFPPIAISMFVKFERNPIERYWEILGWSFYGWKLSIKLDNLDVQQTADSSLFSFGFQTRSLFRSNLASWKGNLVFLNYYHRFTIGPAGETKAWQLMLYF